MEGRPPRLHLRSLAFQVHEGILHYDSHWIEIGGSPLAPRWELRHRVLGSYAVQDSQIDHQGACTVCMHLSQTKLLLCL